MFKSFIAASALLLATVFLPHSSAEAQVRCPSGMYGCTYQSAGYEIRQRVNQGARDVWRNPYSNGRWREVRNTLEDCWKCGAEGLRDGIDRVTGSQIGGYTSRRSRRGAQ